MNKYISLVLIALAMPCFALIGQETSPITIKIKNSDLERKDVMLSAVADEISYIKFETHPDALIGSASSSQVTPIPHGYLIWNRRGSGNIMMFNFEGKFTGHVGSEGKGPGEYYSVYKVLYDKYLDNILVLLRGKVLRYNMEGKFISDIDIDIDTSYSRIDWMCIKDDHTWYFTYRKPLKEQLCEVGILATTKQGEIIKKYNLTDEKSPGSYGIHAQKNRLYQCENDTYYFQYDYYQTYKLNKDDQWMKCVKIEAPFEKPHIDLFKDNNPMNLMKAQRKAGRLGRAFIYGDHMIIQGSTPRVFNILVDLESEEQYNYSYDTDFKKIGLTNDLDGGMPFFLKQINPDGNSTEMIDAVNLLAYAEKGLLKPDAKDHGPHMNLSEVLESTKPDDNPILIVVHIKK